MPRFFMTLSYDGAPFNGWQVQENTPHTVQQVLEEKMTMVFREKISIVGCGRTDTGVNAFNYTAHFDTAEAAFDTKKMVGKLNMVLPPAIALQNIHPVSDDAHARFDAEWRQYYYYVTLEKNVFRGRYSWHVHADLDFDLMNEAASMMLGRHDFGSFSKAHTQNKTNDCNIMRAIWKKSGEHEWRFEIRADRFLRGMVRAIVGTLMLVGKNKISIGQFQDIIASRERRYAGENAPAHALFFSGVKYPIHNYHE